MKKCSKCGEAKPPSEFHKCAKSSDGLANKCKPCKAEYKRAEYIKTRETCLARTAKYRAANPERVSLAKKVSRLKKIDQYKAKESSAYWNNRDAALTYSKEYREKNKEAVKVRNKAYNELHRERKNEYQRAYQANNREARQAYRNEWKKRRRKEDPVFWLRDAARSRVSLAFRNQGYRKTSKARAMIGCDFDQLAAHIEAQFKDGMGWDNRGQWEIDHIVPLASAKTVDELMALCHYTNLQPLWREENRSKGAKIAA